MSSDAFFGPEVHASDKQFGNVIWIFMFDFKKVQDFFFFFGIHFPNI